MERSIAETTAVIDSLPAGSLPRAPSMAQLGIVAVRRSDRQSAERWLAELVPHSGQFHWVLMDRVLGMLAAFLGDESAARTYFKQGRSIAARGQIRPELLRIEGELALLNREPAERIERLKSEMRALHLSDADYLESRWQSGVSRPKGAPAGLSRREIEVLVLVAKGRTSREIADELSISEKTVTNHLTHIFTKANLENRAAAAAFALRHGLVT
jgi:DNA-binding CsgD family transcriptional regulator